MHQRFRRLNRPQRQGLTFGWLVWLIAHIPSLAIAMCFTAAVIALTVIYLVWHTPAALPISFQFLVGPLHFGLTIPAFTVSWKGYLANTVAWNALCTGGFSMFIARCIVVFQRPLRKDRQRMAPLTQAFGNWWGRVLYAGLSLPYIALLLLGAGLWGGFTLAAFLLGVMYAFKAVSTVVDAVFGWIQQGPGALFYALRQALIFGLAPSEERSQARDDLARQAAQAAQIRLLRWSITLPNFSRRFYLVWVNRIVWLSLGGFAIIGAVLLLGFASGANPGAFAVGVVVVLSFIAGIFMGFASAWLSTFLVWVATFGRPHPEDEWHQFQRAAWAAMVAVIPGPPLSLGVGFLMEFLLGAGLSEPIRLGIWVFFSHVTGDILSLLGVIMQALYTRSRSRRGD